MLGSRLAPLPPDCSFTLAVELKEKPQGVAPIGWPMPWVPSEPGSQRAEMGANADDTGSGENGDSESSERVKRGGNLGGVKTTPIRSVEAGPFVMEIWAEEGREKMKVKTEVEDGEGAAKTEKTS
jgi:mitotic spindle assembly checkpoint protein MAD2B